MAMVVQSRFAGLKIEDDDPIPKDNKAKKVTKNGTVKKPDVKKTKSATKPQQSNGTVTKKKNKRPAPTEEQWEQWKQKDEEIVVGAYEDELNQAILLSKLDYEEKKDVYKQIRKQTESDRKVTELAAKEHLKPGQKKQKKKNVMSLDQFNDMVTGGGDEAKRHEELQDEEVTPEEVKSDTEFFERVRDETQRELRKDKHIDQVKQRQPLSDEVINRVQFAEALERKEKVIVELTDEVTRLKEELLTVKSRNKKLCNILGQGEMKDKAQVLVEVERLRQVQAELTAEVASLHTLLEQERSKHPDARSKDKRKKSTTDKEK